MMEGFLSLSESRRLGILEAFYQGGEVIGLDDLSKKLQTSHSTIRNDIKCLNQETAGKLFSIQHNDVHLIGNPQLVLPLYQEIFRSSSNQLLQVFLHLLELRSISVEDLAEQMSLSMSSIYRLINQINQGLEERNFAFYIQTPDLALVGDERQIRAFFIEYLLVVASANEEWPFRSLKQKKVMEFLQELLRTNLSYLDSDYMTIFYSSLFVGVNLIRTQHGYLVDSSSERMDVDFIICHSQDYSQAAYDCLTQDFGLPWEPETFYQIFDQFLVVDYSYQAETLMDEQAIKVQQSYQLIQNILKELCQTYQLKLKNPETLVRRIHNVALLGQEVSMSFQYFISPFNFYLLSIQTDFPYFYRDLQAKLQGYIKQMNYSLDDLMTSVLEAAVVLKWSDLMWQLDAHLSDVKILLINSIALDIVRQLRSLIHRMISPHLTIDTYLDDYNDAEAINTLDYDLIISNHPLDGVDQIPVFVLDFSLFNQRINGLKLEIQRICYEK